MCLLWRHNTRNLSPSRTSRSIRDKHNNIVIWRSNCSRNRLLNYRNHRIGSPRYFRNNK
nr:hypothetical protein Itr_chr10CG18310 [Ipomoea trifida]